MAAPSSFPLASACLLRFLAWPILLTGAMFLYIYLESSWSLDPGPCQLYNQVEQVRHHRPPGANSVVPFSLVGRGCRLLNTSKARLRQTSESSLTLSYFYKLDENLATADLFVDPFMHEIAFEDCILSVRNSSKPLLCGCPLLYLLNCTVEYGTFLNLMLISFF